MRWHVWVAMGLIGCASAAPSEPTSVPTVEEVEPVSEPAEPAEESVAADDPASPSGTASPSEAATPRAEPGEITIRVELEQPEIPRSASRSDRERLDAVIHVRNVGQREITVEGALPLAHQLEWQLRAADGAAWQPTFYPPPMPRAGGPPRRSLVLAPGEEVPFCNLHGISGFQRPGSDTFGPLPPGRYEVVVSGLRLGDTRFAAPPVTLVVR